MKNKKGFTLIELLAVIVILAIIALIATPIILNMIENAKVGAAKDSAYGYIDAIEYNNSLADYNEKYTKIADGTYSDFEQLSNVKVKGKVPDYIEYTILKGSVIKAGMCINNINIDYINNEAKKSETDYCKFATVNSIAINNKITSMKIGETLQLDITIDPSDITPSYKSSNETVATVSNKGLIEAKSPGKITITVKAGVKVESFELEIINKIYKKYEVGELVYYNPISTDTCNEKNFNISDIKDKVSTCYKWRVIEVDDSTSKEDLLIMLDHNLVNRSSWSIDRNNKVGPDNSLQTLANATSEWKRLNLLNYEYDVSEITNGYGSLKCVNGTCVNKNGDELAQNVRARLITGEEVTKITNTVASTTWTINSNESGLYYFSNQNFILGTKTSGTGNKVLSWLIENTRGTTASGATANNYDSATNGGYWTLTPVNGSDNYVWLVGDSGDLGRHYVYDTVNRGLRPVITVSKDDIA